jgi:hypothetical protein
MKPRHEFAAKRGRVAALALVVLDLFLGAAALYGGLAVVPVLPPAWLAGTPFSGFTVPAVALSLVGLGAMAAVIVLAVDRAFGAALSAVVGVAIVIFEIVETLSLSLGDWLALAGIDFGQRVSVPGFTGALHPVLLLQPFFLLYGVSMLALGWQLWRHAHAPQPAGAEVGRVRLFRWERAGGIS